MTYTVYDFINSDIERKNMRFGWKIEVSRSSFHSSIILRYTMLNFNWDSFNMLGGEGWNIFLNSKSYNTMRDVMIKANERFKRTYFEEDSIRNLKGIVERYGLKVNIDRLIEKTIKKKSDTLKKNGIIKNK